MRNLRSKAYDLTLLILSTLTCVGAYWVIDAILARPIADLELLIVGMILVFTALVLVWNSLCALAAWLLVFNLLPHTLAAQTQHAIERWGTQHSRALLQRRLVQGGVLLALASSASACTLPSLASPTNPTEFTPPARAAGRVFEGAAQHESLSLPRPLMVEEEPVTAALPTPSLSDTPTSPPHPTASSPTYTVNAGDSLWAIAESHFPNADVAQIASATEDLFLTNRDVIGDNPDLIYPGMLLSLPTRFQESL